MMGFIFTPHTKRVYKLIIIEFLGFKEIETYEARYGSNQENIVGDGG